MFNHTPMRWFLATLCSLSLAVGCQFFVDHADREVSQLVASRQQRAIAETRPAPINSERVPRRVPRSAYSFAPSPVDTDVPPGFLSSTQPAPLAAPSTGLPDTQPAAGPAPADSQPASDPGPRAADASTQPAGGETSGVAATPPATRPVDDPSRTILTLSGSLSYAFAHSREFQTAKEDLYLAGLALSLERHLWTPIFNGSIGSQYANYGEIRDFDQAMAAVAQVGVEQRLPLGGTVTARVIDNLMRDLTNHVTTGETGQAVLSANIPLLRGAGLVAYESRFQAERNLIYAVRSFETFRRALTVQIAGDYFNLQQLRQSIFNARDNTESLRWLAARARAYYRTGRVILLEAQRADQEVAFAENREIDSAESYRVALDQFKIRIGMPTETSIEIPLPREPGTATQPESSDLETERLEDALTLPSVSQPAAIETALKYRLDLLNQFDRIDDAARGVNVAENNLLPDLNASGSVAWNTNPNSLGTFKYNDDRATWRAGLTLELPLERYAERNQLRSALIQKRRAERDYQAARDTVTLQVRRALRAIVLQRISLQIQLRNRDLAVFRRKGAQIQFLKNRVSNREVTDAESALLDARNRLAQAQSQLRLAILQFRRDSGTLRVDDAGRWNAAADGSAAGMATTRPSG